MSPIGKIHIEHSHGLTIAQVHERLEPLLKSLGDKYGGTAEWTSDAKASLSRTGLTGSLILTDGMVCLDISLTFAMSPLMGKIEQRAKALLALRLAKCPECGDTGVIETGNNDLPCDCPAGDTAIFNAVGGIQQTGKEVRAELQANAGESKRVVNELLQKSAIRELTQHISKCPLGWHDGRVVWHRDRTEADIIAWLQKLDALSAQAGC